MEQRPEPRQNSREQAYATGQAPAERNASADLIRHELTLDVVICTYNRRALLKKAIESIMRASVPQGLEVNVFVVDNNSSDGTRALVQELQAVSPLPMHYVFETRQSSSYSRNAGIAAGRGELVAMIDDDEEVHITWFEVIAREFRDSSLLFIGGPFLPKWEAPPPAWLPPGYHAVIGAIPPKPRGRYSSGRVGMLSGGNSVVRRAVYETVGGYSLQLGRTNKGLLSEEDAEFFRRMLAAGIDGTYVPDLLVDHYVPAERLTRRYHRRWAFWRGVSHGVLDRVPAEPVTYLLGVPRHLIGRAVRRLLALPFHSLLQRNPGKTFAAELASWDLLGFVYGKFLFRQEPAGTRSKAPARAGVACEG